MDRPWSRRHECQIATAGGCEVHRTAAPRPCRCLQVGEVRNAEGLPELLPHVDMHPDLGCSVWHGVPGRTRGRSLLPLGHVRQPVCWARPGLGGRLPLLLCQLRQLMAVLSLLVVRVSVVVLAV